MAAVETAPAGPVGGESSVPPPPAALHVVYCGVCALPPEYCEFGATLQKCSEWLAENEPEMHARIYGDVPSEKLESLSLNPTSGPSKDALKKAAKASQAEAKLASLKKTSKIVLSLQSRGKNKSVTSVQGLELHGLDLKKVSKALGKKFASGASVGKMVDGTKREEVVIQGDLRYDIQEWIEETYPEVPAKLIVVEEPKKKNAS